MRIVVTKATKLGNWIGLQFYAKDIVPPGELEEFPRGAYEVVISDITRVLEDARPEEYEKWMQQGQLGELDALMNEHAVVPCTTFIPIDCAEIINGEA